MSDWNCAGCGENTELEYYMVHDQMWVSYGVGQAMLCIGCLEARLERQLNADDFTDCILNTVDMGWEKSERLKDRLCALS
jgi:hypothetical protein